MARRSRGARIARRGAIALVTALVVAIVAGLPLYVFPPTEPVGTADVIFVLGPNTQARLAVAKQMRADGVADRILVSVPLTGGQSAPEQSICAEPDVTCTHAVPATTKGEVAMLHDYAATHPADKVVVLTFTPHVARTRYIFGRCSQSEVTVVAVDEHLSLWEWAYQYAYQTVGFVKAWLTPCADDGATGD